jgi:DNA-binding transcriptional LysR family regulator
VELRHLRYFTAVAENGGFGRASRILHVAQSAISEQIQDLEEELGVKLFERHNRRITLTYHGEQFLDDSRAILALVDKAVVNVKKSKHGEAGTLTIGFFGGGTGTFFPAIIQEFRHRFPDVQLSLVEMPSGIQNDSLQSGAIDIGFTRTVPPVFASQLRAVPIHSEPLYAAMLRTHALARKQSILLRDLANERFILNDRRYSPAVFDKVITLCTEAGFSPQIAATASVSSGVIALVEAGEGVAILPHGSHIFSGAGVTFVRLADPGAFVEIVVAWSAEYERPVVRSFVELASKRQKKRLADTA